MSDSIDRKKRLDSEAAFQDARVAAQHRGERESRDRFYYLAERAFSFYHNTLPDVYRKRVLVVGCSEGGVTPLARRGANVVGIDISEEAITHLNDAIEKENLSERASARWMDAEKLDFSPQSFDMIVCTGVLHHLNIESAADSWARALKPDGMVTMLEPMAWHPVVAAYRLFTPSMRTPDEHPLAPADVRTLRRHFRNVSVEGYALTSVLSLFVSYLSNSKDLRDRSCRWLERIDTSLMKRLPWLAYLCWTSVIVCREPLGQGPNG